MAQASGEPTGAAAVAAASSGAPGLVIDEGVALLSSDDPQVCTEACDKLSQVLFNQPVLKAYARDRGAMAALAGVLQRHQDLGVACSACKAVRTLVMKDKENRSRARTEGAITGLILVLQRATGTSTSDALKEAMWALTVVCSNDDANVTAALTLGAAVAVRTAMALPDIDAQTNQMCRFVDALLTDAEAHSSMAA